MAPPLHRRDGNDAFDAYTVGASETKDASNSMARWLIAVIIIGVLGVTFLVVFLVLYVTRRRQRLQDQTDPLGKGFKKRRLNPRDRQAMEEIERATMIRKSLASRTSSRNSQVWGSTEYQFQELDQEDRSEPAAPAENWKEFEAGQRPVPGVQDTQMGIHPAFLQQPQLTVPPPPRTPSPSRGPQPPRLMIPL
ncbi:uncharacterized protein F4812DRAFT_406908 [Daldinia caldariorum]|uniref:uncharacterized protein n=1 Tax=Daldinia caldariorum TaxID=326644 RepID=UPI002007530E|nr:uncharacterized protein F4812DRAFT_406908 [Daldinia caldariorum]KAI1467726.1 hypothetical protein F4812DRAFT_406908 [Daldinia caldariorum]